MATRVLNAVLDEDVCTAGELLRAGELVAFPTETVYGLGARADDAGALAALCAVKRRPTGKKFTILIPHPDDCGLYAAPLCVATAALAREFWPGPLTLVVPDGKGGEVGLRCPDCEVTRRMLGAAGAPIAAPSANVSGQPPARSADEVLAVFQGLIAAVLDGGTVGLGEASTVVRVSQGGIEVLREGALSREEILRAAQSPPQAP